MIQDKIQEIICLLKKFKAISLQLEVYNTSGINIEKSAQQIFATKINNIFCKIRGILDQISYELKTVSIENSLDDLFESHIAHFFACYNGVNSYKAFDTLTYLVERIPFLKDWVLKLEKKKIHLIASAKED